MSSSLPPSRTYRRQWRNYLLDAPLQLRIAGSGLGIVLVCGTLSGVLLHFTHKTLDEGARSMLAAGTSAEQASKKLALTVLKEKAIDLEFDPVHGEPGGDRRLAIEQQFATQQAAIATQNRVQVAAQRDALGWLGLGLVLCFTAVGAAGVVLSHRITGPLYRMGKILDEVSTGNLSFLHRPLRRGDLLGAFYDRFCAMFDTMRTQQLDELAQLDAMMIAAERSDLGAVMASLQALRKQKQATLGLPEGSLGMLSVAPVPVSASKPVQLQRE